MKTVGMVKKLNKRCHSGSAKKAKRKRLSADNATLKVVETTSDVVQEIEISPNDVEKVKTNSVTIKERIEGFLSKSSKEDGEITLSSDGGVRSPLGPDIPITQMIKPYAATLSRVRMFNALHSELPVLVLKAGECVKIWGACQLMSIVGEAVIDSFVLRPAAYSEDRLVDVCAPYRTGKPLLLVGNQSIDVAPANRVLWRLKEVSSEPTTTAIMKLYEENPSGISIIIINKRLTPIQNIVDNIHDRIFLPPGSDSATRGNFSCTNADDFYTYSKNSSIQLKELMDKIKAKRGDGEKMCVVPVGSKGTGKSSMMRKLVNDLLSGENEAPVYVMDVDIGQSEFAPMACMSLVKVEKPLLDLPFCRQPAYFKHSYLFGNITPDYDIKRYNVIVKTLYEAWKTSCEPGSVIIVNTMGYIQGIGAEALDHIFKVTRPFAAIYMNPAPITRPGVPNNSAGYYNIPSGPARIVRVDRYLWDNSVFGGASQSWTLNAATLRSMSLLGYLTQALPKTRYVMSAFVDITPYKVPFSAITLSIPEDLGNIEEEGVLASINCTLVALGYWETEQKTIRLFNNSSMPNIRHTTAGNSALRVLGFGIVRAIDIDQRLFYVITPIPASQLEQVTVFERMHNVHLPSGILNAQPTDEVPYVVRGARRGNNVLHDMYKGLKNSTGMKRSRGPASFRGNRR